MAKKNIATFLGASPTLVITGNRCYAYSGVVTTSGETTLLEFTTGNKSILAELQYVSGTDSGVDQEAKIYLNGIIVYQPLHNETRDQFNDAKFPQILVLPPRTNFKFTITPGSGTPVWSATLTGRILDA